MHVFWETVIVPVLNILKPRTIVEIGADEGLNTREILAYCRQTGAFAHVIDPHPQFDPGELDAWPGDVLCFHKELSLNCLPLIEKMDVVLIDGDHNWYTVFNELQLIEKHTRSRQSGFPLVFLHDIAWPYGRRDLYYNPENIPAQALNPYARKGLDPLGSGLKEQGGFNSHLFHAIHENTPKNGVLTAVEDFMQATGLDLDLVKIPAFHGLGILFGRERFGITGFSEFVGSLLFSGAGSQVVAELESSRVKTLAGLEESRQQARALEKEKRRRSEEWKALEKSLRADLKSRENRVTELEQTVSRQALHLEALEETRKKESAAFRKEREQFVRWMRQLREQFTRLMHSRRWKLGHGLVSMLTLSGLKRNGRMASDHIWRVFSEFEASKERGSLPAPNTRGLDLVFFWKQNDTGIYGRRIDMLVQHLAKRSEIGAIAVFDRPLSSREIKGKPSRSAAPHDRLVQRETLLKNAGERDRDNLRFRTFVYSAGKGGISRKIWRTPKKKEYMAYIGDRLREIGIAAENAVFWFYPENPYIPEIVRRFQPAVTVVDLVDDHRKWPGISALRKLRLNRHYKEVLGLADIAMTNCRRIQDSMRQLHPDIKLVPNACDPEPPPDLTGDPAFEGFREIPRPRIGYVGNFEKAKLDVDLMHHIARTHPDWQLVLIGSTHANPGVMELDRHDNIHFLGVVPYPEVKAWIREFDVAIMPHLNSAQTRSMNPLKLYVYCAQGVPVVSTDVAHIDAFRSFIAVADSPGEFVEGIENALKHPRCKISRDMQRQLNENSWHKRVDTIIEQLSAHKQRREG